MKTKTQKKKRKAWVKKMTKKQKDLILRNYSINLSASKSSLREKAEERIRRKYGI